MNDMSAVIIPRSDQLNADTLVAGPMTVTIREVQIRGGQEQPVSMILDGTALFYRPCKSMSRLIVAAWGPDASKYVGRSLTLYRDPSVKWAGMDVGGIRISHMSHIESVMTMALTATRGSRKPFTVQPLVATGADSLRAAATDEDLRAVWAGMTEPAKKSAWKHLTKPEQDAMKLRLNPPAKTAAAAPETLEPDQTTEF